MDNDVACMILAKAASDKSYLQTYLKDPDQIFRKEKVRDPDEITELKESLSPIIMSLGKISDSGEIAILGQVSAFFLSHKGPENPGESTMRTANMFKQGLRDTIDQIEKAFGSVMTMYKISFYLGVVLIVSSLVIAIWREESLLPIVLGGLGSADIIAYFITNPPQNLQESRANLAQLQAAFYNWFMDNYNWHVFLSELGETTPEGRLPYLKATSQNLIGNTAKTMQMINQYCKSPQEPAKEKTSQGDSESST